MILKHVQLKYFSPTSDIQFQLHYIFASFNPDRISESVYNPFHVKFNLFRTFNHNLFLTCPIFHAQSHTRMMLENNWEL